jgi:DNA ligase (NAD+)
MFVSYDEYLEKVKRAVEYGVAYYNATPLVEDAVYDALYAELVEYETAHPNEVLDYSPTQRVGAEVQQGTFNKYTHKEKMLSLNNAFTDVDVQKFLNKVITEDTKSSIIIEPKIDGVAISLIYENGKLVTGVTRGDGYVGEDITNNIKQIVNIPQILNTTESIEIRGEAYISNRDFETINEFQQKNNKKLYANPRNLTSGTLKSLNPKEVKSRKVRFIAYYLNSDTLDNIETQEKSLLRLKSFGFEVPPFVKCKTNNDVEIMNIINTLNKNTYLYSIDGAVLKVNDIDLRTVLGETAHAPSWAIAFKYPPMEATTILKDIEWGVGRTGKITPVGILEPVRLSGSVVGRVSLHNEDFIKKRI